MKRALHVFANSRYATCLREAFPAHLMGEVNICGSQLFFSVNSVFSVAN